jgi:hypothetical protein|tara:strand:+ start:1365 stop:1844 length:480 start_codon:yes stop_codon:yes gene_type:complete
MNLNELRDFKLTLDEWNLIPGIGAGHMTYERKQAHVDMLVLAGLVEHTDAESLALTPDGEAAAAAIDVIFDWDDFALVTDEPAKVNALADALARPERLTVGSLVRHVRTGGVGLITEHTMWDADHGAFRVNFVKPVAMSDLTSQLIDNITDRHDTFERV